VAGSVDLLGALIGEDQIRWVAFGLDMLGWTAAALTADLILRRVGG
jgi:hypothetical protein